MERKSAEIYEVMQSFPQFTRSYSGSSYLLVDLRAPDAELFDKFKKWLKLKRVELGESVPKRYFTRRNFDEWHVEKILPFLDLYIWDQLGSQSMTFEEFGTLIHPYEEELEQDIPGKIRRTLKPKALRLITPPYLGIMAREIFYLLNDPELRLRSGI